MHRAECYENCWKEIPFVMKSITFNSSLSFENQVFCKHYS